MINKEEKKAENIKNEECKHENDDFVQTNLVEFLEIQLKESKEKILEKKISSEKEIVIITNRLNKEIDQTKKFALEKLIINFLPIFDNIERALNLIENNKSNKVFNKIKDKLEVILNLFKECCKLFHIKKIDNINVSFNPSIHEAMSVHYTNDMEPNKIVNIMQTGYILYNTRLLRPAMVIVSKQKI